MTIPVFPDIFRNSRKYSGSVFLPSQYTSKRVLGSRCDRRRLNFPGGLPPLAKFSYQVVRRNGPITTLEISPLNILAPASANIGQRVKSRCANVIFFCEPDFGPVATGASSKDWYRVSSQ